MPGNRGMQNKCVLQWRRTGGMLTSSERQAHNWRVFWLLFVSDDRWVCLDQSSCCRHDPTSGLWNKDTYAQQESLVFFSVTKYKGNCWFPLHERGCKSERLDQFICQVQKTQGSKFRICLSVYFWSSAHIICWINSQNSIIDYTVMLRPPNTRTHIPPKPGLLILIF